MVDFVLHIRKSFWGLECGNWVLSLDLGIFLMNVLKPCENHFLSGILRDLGNLPMKQFVIFLIAVCQITCTSKCTAI